MSRGEKSGQSFTIVDARETGAISRALIDGVDEDVRSGCKGGARRKRMAFRRSFVVALVVALFSIAGAAQQAAARGALTLNQAQVAVSA